ncbi:MAG: nicotinate-nucleotide adenylyltransferase [Bacteroidetes bacterium]|nr:nicotinate-nucleotide adenylyltransferase [Bacteroidota bacterium]
MKIGLFFGSFNPIHNGHLIIAQSFLNETDLEEIWFVVSPQNPLKDKSQLEDENLRLELVHKSTHSNPKFKVCDLEFTLPKPSYTFNTLSAIKTKYPGSTFVLLIGSDSLNSFSKWKNFKEILISIHLYVYPRAIDYRIPDHLLNYRITLYNMPLLNVSSSFIRSLLMQGKSIQYLVPSEVFSYYNSL